MSADITQDSFLQTMLAAVNTVAKQNGLRVGGMPNYRYYNHPRKLFRYGWNTEPMTASPKPWAAFVYKVNKSKGMMEQVKIRYFSKRKSAKACALRWYQTAKAQYEKGKAARLPYNR